MSTPSTPTSRPSIRKLLDARTLIAVLATALLMSLAGLGGVGPMARADDALEEVAAAAVEGPVDYVYVATGQDFPDALAASTIAAAREAPLLLVTRTGIPGATRTALEALDPNRIIIVGGTAVVTNGVRDALVPYASAGVVTRLAGGNRAETAADVAAALPEVQPGKVYHLNVSSGGTVRSSLTSGPLRGSTIFRPAGQDVGHYCIDVPNGLFDVFGTVGVVQSTATTGTAGADDIRVTTTFAGSCQTAGAEIDVRLSTDAGSLANGYFTLLIPGRD